MCIVSMIKQISGTSTCPCLCAHVVLEIQRISLPFEYRETFRGLFYYGSVYHGNYSDGLSSMAGVHLNSFRGI